MKMSYNGYWNNPVLENLKSINTGSKKSDHHGTNLFYDGQKKSNTQFRAFSPTSYFLRVCVTGTSSDANPSSYMSMTI